MYTIFSSRRRHTRCSRDWSSDVCSSDLHQLARFIREHELTQWFSVPSVLNYMAKFDAVRQDDFPTVRRLLWCGEVFPTSALIYWMRRLPHVAFTNLYGPTAPTIASSY